MTEKLAEGSREDISGVWADAGETKQISRDAKGKF